MQDDKKPTVGKLGKQLGESGVIIQNGIITAEEYNRALIGRTGNTTFDTMRRSDATIHAILQLCKLPILGLKWDVEPASDDPNDVFIAEFIEDQLMERNVNWQQLLSGGLTMFDFGFSLHEKTYELTEYEGKTLIGLQSVGFRKQISLFTWQTQDGKPGITQQLVGQTVSIPAEKLIVWTNEKEGDNYEGISLLRFAYKDWYMKDNLVKVNGISLEKQGIGIPIITFEQGSDEGEKAKARTLLRQLRANEEAYLEVPKGSTVEMMDMKGSTTKEILPTIQYHDRQIALSVLGQFLMLGQSDASGSRAVSSDHSKLFLQSEEAAAKNVQSTLQKQLVEQLCYLNFSNLPNGCPQLTHSRLQDDDVTVLADAVQKLMSAGALTPDPQVEEHLRETLHLPDLPDELKTKLEDEMKNPSDVIVTDPNSKPDEAIIDQAATDTASPKLSLNGAQVSSLLEIVNQVAMRMLPRETGIDLMTTAFSIDKNAAEEIMGEVGITFFVNEVNNQQNQPADKTKTPPKSQASLIARAKQDRQELIDILVRSNDN